MTQSWLQELEKKLEEGFSLFLEQNPYQASLLEKQNQKDSYELLMINYKEIQADAETKRNELLSIAKEVKEWAQRATKAREAKAFPLANKAEAHILNLKQKGERVWSELYELGKKFYSLKQRIQSIQEKGTRNVPNLDKEWIQFEAEEELEKLRRKSGFNN